MLSSSLGSQIVELLFKEIKILLLDEIFLFEFSVFRGSFFVGFVCDDDFSDRLFLSAVMGLTVLFSLEVSDDNSFSFFGFFVYESESIDIESVREIFDYL